MHRFDFLPGDHRISWTPATPAAARLLNTDVATTLPNDSLVALDRASMATGLQLRAPMLNRELVEFVLSLPTAENGGIGMAERALQQLTEHYVGGDREVAAIADRGPPLAEWLRGPLIDWADDLLSAERLNGDDLLRAEPILAAWRQHRDGAIDRSGDLWTVLMFQAWRAEWL
jgi:asparagine synthase (glutamine-hydrolysing)